MFFKCLSTGLLDSNCYIIGNQSEAVIIDAGVHEDEILKVLSENERLFSSFFLVNNKNALMGINYFSN